MSTPPLGSLDWNARYASGDTPWDQHSTTQALDRILREWKLSPGRVLEMGCGTGENAILLARRGFAVTAFDLAPRAIARAQARATEAGVRVAFQVADFRQFTDFGAPFPFVFDSGLYHCAELEPMFALVELRETHFEAAGQPNGWHPLAWSALLRRR